MRKGISLRGAKEQDYEFMYRLHREALKEYIDWTWGWDEDRQANYFKEHFDLSGKKIIQHNGMDIGCLAVQDKGDHIFLSYIALLPPHQGRGIGSTLIKSVLDEARKKDLPVKLKVLRNNPAHRLYERLGFRVMETSKTHYIMIYDH
jgi:ribosomal protein S18 acetylase RimI-like enzyme